MANEYAVNSADLTAVADAIRSRTGGTDAIAFPDGFAAAIAALTAGSGLAYDMGEFSVTEDVNTNVFCSGNASAGDPTPDGIPHNLGDVPDFICVWTDAWAGITEAPYTSGTTMVGFVWLNGMTGMTGKASSTVNTTNPIIVILNMAAGDYRVATGSVSSYAYGIVDDRLPDENVFRTLTVGTSTWWRAGVTYKYFVSKAWWTVGGDADA